MEGSRAHLLRKALNQWLDGADDRASTAAFVLGAPDPVADAVVAALGEAEQAWAFPAAGSLAHEGGRLRGPATVAALLRVVPADVVVFDALHDSHLADRLLALHEGAKAVWLYRPWRDAAASLAAAHGQALSRAVADLAAGRTDVAGGWGERLPDTLLAQVKEIASVPLHPVGAAALLVYLRHSFLFALGLDADPRVRVVRLDAPDAAATLAAFLGLPAVDLLIPPAPSDLPPEPPADVSALAEALQRRLDTAWVGGAAG